MIKFKLIHKETGLTLRQYKDKFPLFIYGIRGFRPTEELKNRELQYMIREDGAIAVQRKDMWYGDTRELFFLKREDWEVVFVDDYECVNAHTEKLNKIRELENKIVELREELRPHQEEDACRTIFRSRY